MTPNNPSDSSKRKNWWGEYTLHLCDTSLLKVGPLTVQFFRNEKEWQITHSQNKLVSDSEENQWSFENSSKVGVDQGETQRHIFNETEDIFSVTPKLPDRPVVIKTAQPLNIHPGQQANIFVSIPLWLVISLGTEKPPIQEIPIVRPSDTWFGPSTMEGDLCYSSTTQGRLFINELPRRPHRAISSVLIQNTLDKTLTLEKFSVPAPYLSLFASEDGSLWTEVITLLNDDESDLAKVSVSEESIKPGLKIKKIAEPRMTAQKNMLLRTFTVLFQ